MLFLLIWMLILDVQRSKLVSAALNWIWLDFKSHFPLDNLSLFANCVISEFKLTQLLILFILFISVLNIFAVWIFLGWQHKLRGLLKHAVCFTALIIILELDLWPAIETLWSFMCGCRVLESTISLTWHDVWHVPRQLIVVLGDWEFFAVSFVVDSCSWMGVALLVLVSFCNFMRLYDFKLVQEMNVSMLLFLLLEQLGILVLVRLHDHLPWNWVSGRTKEQVLLIHLVRFTLPEVLRHCRRLLGVLVCLAVLVVGWVCALLHEVGLLESRSGLLLWVVSLDVAPLSPQVIVVR